MFGKNQSLKFIIPIVALVVIGAVVCGGIWYWRSNNVPPSSTNTQIPDNTITEEVLPSTSDEIGNTAVQWNKDALLLPDLKLILKYQDDYDNFQPSDTPQTIKHYDLGTNNNNKIILAVAPAIDPSGPAIFFFEQTPQGDRLMSKMSSASIYSPEAKQGYVLVANLIEPDITTFYNGIVGPKNLTYHGTKLQQGYTTPSNLFKNYASEQATIPGVSITRVDTIDAGDLYLLQHTAGDNTTKFYVRKYLLKLPSGLYTAYNTRYDFFTDNLVPQITWNNGDQNKDTYRQDASLGGCGNPDSYIVPNIDVSNAIQISGTTNNGEPIYEFKDFNNSIMKFFYDLGGKTFNPTTSQYENISLEQWGTHHPVILYKNALGDYVIFTSDKYGSGTECGKPVIYLYPTTPTNVKVQVGAQITKSEPAYANGWQVQAQPNGKLINTDGLAYDYLFWEGTGNGFYPTITEGIVVPQDQLASTIKLQLKELGLSNKESTDFLEFWLPKLPNTPYTRLTWFTTKQLNELAPLVVWPKPDTIIRVFLDFQGLQKPISIPTQQLTTIPRQGFTLVEWGGLLKK